VITALALAGRAALNVLPNAPAWDLGGPLALFAEAFALYRRITVRRARRGSRECQGRAQ
jgi:hypothetical protein